MSRWPQRTDVVPLREAWPLWMTAATAAKYLDFSSCKDPRDAFDHFARKTGLVARGRRGDVRLWHRLDLDRAVTKIAPEVTRVDFDESQAIAMGCLP